MPRRSPTSPSVPHARVLAYARVSSQAQALGTSLEDQQRCTAAYAASRGLTVSTHYVEAESAVFEKLEKRVEMVRLMSDARAGDLVLCARMDRWSRDPEYSYRSVRELLARGCGMYFVDDRIDPSTPDGDSAMGLRILVAREEHKRIRERLVGTRLALADAGFYAHGLPPLGYARGAPKGARDPTKNILVVVDDGARVVKEIFAMAGTGHSIAAIMRATGQTRDRVCDVLHARTYLGEVRDSRGVWIRGRHPAIVTIDVWTRAHEGLAARRHGGARPRGAGAETDGWMLRDVATCALCGARMGAAYAGPHERRRHYYRCARACTTRYVRVEPAEAATAPLVLARLAELREEMARPSAPAPRTGPSTADRRAKLEAKRARYLELYADGLLERGSLAAAVGRVDAELARLDAEAAPRAQDDPLARRQLLASLEVIEAAWLAADGPRRRRIVRDLAERVRLAAGQAPVPEWRSVDALVSEACASRRPA